MIPLPMQEHYHQGPGCPRAVQCWSALLQPNHTWCPSQWLEGSGV